MSKQLTFFLFVCTILQTLAQEKRVVISGIIISDAQSKENIHILNKNSSKGTISNIHGNFTIPVKEDDTLVFSGIQFYKKEIFITKQIINNRKIHIELFQKINELDEVEVRTLILSGNLITDAKNVKDSISMVNPMALDFSMIDFSKPVVSNNDEVDRQKPPDISHLVSPIIIGVSASFGFRKLQTKEEKKLKILKKKFELTDKIKALLSEEFFINSLNIPFEKIDAFIEHCNSKGIIDLYINNKKIEVIDILIIESKNYKK